MPHFDSGLSILNKCFCSATHSIIWNSLVVLYYLEWKEVFTEILELNYQICFSWDKHVEKSSRIIFTMCKLTEKLDQYQCGDFQLGLSVKIMQSTIADRDVSATLCWMQPFRGSLCPRIGFKNRSTRRNLPHAFFLHMLNFTNLHSL